MALSKIAAAYLAFSLAVYPQTQPSTEPTFDVASVKLSTPASSPGAEFNEISSEGAPACACHPKSARIAIP